MKIAELNKVVAQLKDNQAKRNLLSAVESIGSEQASLFDEPSEVLA